MKTQYNMNSGLKSRPEQAGTDKLPKLDLTLRRKNRRLPVKKLLALLADDEPEFQKLARVVGRWVWIEFQEKQPREITSALSQLGFHWNRRRQAWQHPCGKFAVRPSPYDPRSRYGQSLATH